MQVIIDNNKIMRSFLLLVILCQLAIATRLNVSPVAVVGDANNSYPSKERSEGVIQNLRLSTKAKISEFVKVPQCGDGSWYQLVGFNMSTPDSQCPVGWVEENEGGVRACGRGTIGASCQSDLPMI